MNLLRTLALSLVFVSGAAFAGERQALETYLSPAPSLMPILVKQAGELGLSAEQQARLADWRRAAQPGREKLEREIAADRLAINQAMLDDRNNQDVQKRVRDVQRKEIKLVVSKLACRDNARKILTPEQWSKLIALYQAQP
ncbi:MAG: Spy/CpxP family protein refolding chaperone [Thiobacillus sp.]|nr:Spy/CpxP family protein refolding chaperone [Thiobacillus sp.]